MAALTDSQNRIANRIVGVVCKQQTLRILTKNVNRDLRRIVRVGDFHGSAKCIDPFDGSWRVTDGFDASDSYQESNSFSPNGKRRLFFLLKLKRGKQSHNHHTSIAAPKAKANLVLHIPSIKAVSGMVIKEDVAETKKLTDAEKIISLVNSTLDVESYRGDSLLLPAVLKSMKRKSPFTTHEAHEVARKIVGLALILRENFLTVEPFGRFDGGKIVEHGNRTFCAARRAGEGAAARNWPNVRDSPSVSSAVQKIVRRGLGYFVEMWPSVH